MTFPGYNKITGKLFCPESIFPEMRCFPVKKDPASLGILAAATPIPLFFATVFWSWFWCFGIWLRLFPNNDPQPLWFTIFILFPLFVSPILGILGVISGIRNFKNKDAREGLLWSIAGLAENALIFGGMMYLAQF